MIKKELDCNAQSSHRKRIWGICIHLADIFSFCRSLEVNTHFTHSYHTQMVVVCREVLSDIEVSKHLLRFSAAPYIKEAAQFVRGKITPAQGTKSSGCGRTTGPHRSGGGQQPFRTALCAVTDASKCTKVWKRWNHWLFWKMHFLLKKHVRDKKQ